MSVANGRLNRIGRLVPKYGMSGIGWIERRWVDREETVKLVLATGV
jgi:hypothetical protein